MNVKGIIVLLTLVYRTGTLSFNCYVLAFLYRYFPGILPLCAARCGLISRAAV